MTSRDLPGLCALSLLGMAMAAAAYALAWLLDADVAWPYPGP